MAVVDVREVINEKGRGAELSGVKVLIVDDKENYSETMGVWFVARSMMCRQYAQAEMLIKNTQEKIENDND